VKKYVLICFTAFLGLTVYSQSEYFHADIIKKIDSLETILKSTSVTKESKPELVKVCNNLTELYPLLSFPQQIEYVSNIQTIIEELNEKTININLLAIKANAYYKIDDFESSIEVYYKIFNLYSISGEEVSTGDALMKIGQNYYMLNKFLKAKDYYERAMDIYKKNQYYTGIADALQSIAVILSHWGEYDEALNYNFEALNFWKEMDNIFQIANVNYNIGIIYKELGDLNHAKECFQKSLNLFVEINKIKEVVNATAHIGDIYMQSKDYDKALEYCMKADMLGQQVNDKALSAETSFNLGKVYNLIGDYIKAIDYQRKAIRLNEDQNNIRSLVENYAELGLVYYNFGQLDQALFYLQKGINISLEMNYKYQTTIYYKHLSKVYSAQRNFEAAFKSYESYIEGRDLIKSEESKLKTDELLAKYQVSVKEKENETLRHNEELKNAQIFNQWLIIALVAFALLCLLIVSTIFRRRYKMNRRLNVQLSLKNKEIESHQKKVENLNADLQTANAAKDRFFSIIGHDLKNPFNSLMGLLELLIDDYQSFTDDERKEFLEQMKSSSDRIYAMLQNLLLWGSNQMGKTELIRERIDLYKLTQETISLTQLVADRKSITINKNITPGTFAYADKNMVSTVFLNLITNAIKFTPQNGTIEIHTFSRNHEVEVMVADSGVGISPGNLEKLFKLDEKIQSDGTNKEKGTGLGLILCKEFVERNNGRIYAESIEGSGSWFYFTLPVSQESISQNSDYQTIHKKTMHVTF
jgi:signal transduction histidine kinase